MDIMLACDLGTSSCKLTAVDLSPRRGRGGVLGTANRPYLTHHAHNGWAEQTPADWLGAFGHAISDIAAVISLRHLRGLVFTGQMSAALAVDGAGRALGPALIWSDQRATVEAQAAGQRISPDAFYRLTGNALNATYTAPKLAWLKHHRSDAWASAACFLQPKDWLIAQLTGERAMDHSDASCTGLYDLVAGSWSPLLFDLYDLPSSLAPPLVEAATVVGTLRPAMAGRLGLPDGLPVVLGGGDGPTSALGTGIGRDEAYLSLGTSAWISFLHERPISDPARRVFTFRHVLPNLYAVTGSTQNAANVLSWLGNLLAADDLAAAVKAALATVPPGADGLLVLPYLYGERTPVWDSAASGAIVGLRSHHGKPHLLRAFVEAICFQLNLILDTFTDCGLSTADLRVVGGLSSEPLLMKLLATVTGLSLRRPPTHGHSTAMGAAIVGGLALGSSGDDLAGLTAREEDEVYPPGLKSPSLKQNEAAFRSLYAALQAIMPTATPADALDRDAMKGDACPSGVPLDPPTGPGMAPRPPNLRSGQG